MRQRIALGGVSVTVVLALLFVWSAITTEPVSAMERMRESISKAKSYKMKMITEVELVRKPGQPPVKTTIAGNWYWLAPGSVRMEVKGGEHIDHTNLYPAGKPGIHIGHKTKTFRREPARQGRMSPIMMLEGLRKYSGQADRELGTKAINGQEARGFVIDSKKIDPNAYTGSVEIWIDAESHLPAELRIEMKNAQVPMTVRMVDFQWNIQLDPKLFEPTPPDGYTDATPKPPSLEEQVREMSEALKLYAELSGGHYPRGKMVYGDVTRDEMRRMAGFKGQPTPDELREEKYVKILNATRGLATISGILRDNSDAAYFGRTVGPQDKDKVLLRWKLADGRFHVMYGDLRGETVTAARLRTLEGR